VVDLGPFRKGQKQWKVDVFWCEGPGADKLKAQAQAYVADLRELAVAGQTENDVIAHIELRPISERKNAFPSYQITQNEIRYELADESERKWAERLKIGSGEAFVSHPVTKSTPARMSVFLCAAQEPVD
jgi:hypothetical protein